MDISFPQTRPQNEPDRLGFSMFLAIAVHALVIFGIGFKMSQSQPAAPILDVTLAQHQSDVAPEDADYLAQVDQQGSGDLKEAHKLTTNRQSEIIDPKLRELSAIPQPIQQTEQPAGQLPTLNSTTANQDKASDKQERTEQELHFTTPLPPAAVQEFSSLKAKLDSKQQEYSRLPRVLRMTSASTKAAEQASYLNYWVDRIELVGNQNYPEEARRKSIYGDLRLAVTLLPDGSVETVEILLSSGHRVLDQAAVRVVRLASPFSPFPAEMKQWDKLEIIRTWRFIAGDQLHTKN